MRITDTTSFELYIAKRWLSYSSSCSHGLPTASSCLYQESLPIQDFPPSSYHSLPQSQSSLKRLRSGWVLWLRSSL
ncbi:hypothetical protein NC651_014613 [Populus alba x Populus x berolinensis]|nr:hypothetical protein NC651_014613 [Populus alba x Populus x berolinensis]